MRRALPHQSSRPQPDNHSTDRSGQDIQADEDFQGARPESRSAGDDLDRAFFLLIGGSASGCRRSGSTFALEAPDPALQAKALLEARSKPGSALLLVTAKGGWWRSEIVLRAEALQHDSPIGLKSPKSRLIGKAQAHLAQRTDGMPSSCRGSRRCTESRAIDPPLSAFTMKTRSRRFPWAAATKSSGR